MMNIVICDDNLEQINNIKASLDTYIDKRLSDDVLVSIYTQAEELDRKLESFTPEIALLDICMPGMLGTDIGKKIRNKSKNTQIIFITNSDEFAVDAFMLKAAHYILKPFSQGEFDEAMDRAIVALNKNETKNFVVRTDDGGIYNIDTLELMYAESSSHCVILHLKNGIVYENRRGLANLFEEIKELHPKQFFIPHKGYILNFAAVHFIGTDTIQLKNGEKIPLAKRNAKKIKELYLNYAFVRRRI